MTQPFYKSMKWKRKRDRILRRDEYLCQECKRYGRTTAAQTVHHIHPLEQYPELALATVNLVSLCNACHDSMHDRTTGVLTTAGERWFERAKRAMAEENVEGIPPSFALVK